MEIQQKVKRYKDRILELENELEQGAAAITAYEQKVTYCFHLQAQRLFTFHAMFVLGNLSLDV